MSILIKKATIIDEKSKHHLKKMDILIEKGQITDIKSNITTDAKKTVKGKNLIVTNGLIDIHANFNDPGNEHKEDLRSGAMSAKNGGFSRVIISANNHPVTDTKSQVEYITTKAKNTPIEIMTFAALSEGLEGRNFTEMYDLSNAGAVGFSDGHRSIVNPDLLKRALQYSKTFGAKVVVYPHDSRISHGGLIHEGTSGAMLGIKSDPSLSEEIMVARDLSIAEYCEASIHFMTISCAESVDLIRKAKKRGVQVTCDVAIANLIWNESALEGFDSNFKVTPPLRSEKDRKALIKGVKEGTIDSIVSNHVPQNIEEKQCEFDLAGFGQSSLDTAYSAYNTYLSDQITIEEFVKATTTNTEDIFGLENAIIAKGEKANITVFDQDEKWMVTSKDLKSKSKNTPHLNTELLGRVIEVIN